jgi:hypothetical protein
VAWKHRLLVILFRIVRFMWNVIGRYINALEGQHFFKNPREVIERLDDEDLELVPTVARQIWL